MPDVRRLTIAAKLLIWASALIIIFFATTVYLFQQVREDATVSQRIVKVNHVLDSAIQRMLDRLYNVQENIQRYRLTGNSEAVTFIVNDLTRFGEVLDETLRQNPQYRKEWGDLNNEFEITIDPDDPKGNSLAPDETILDWTNILEQSLFDNQADMEVGLTQLHEAGQRAANIGLYGLIICLGLGIGGSLLLAYYINRSLTEIRSGIIELGRGPSPKDVRVLSGDELGELALAFNAMAARLRREEAMRADFIAMLSHEIRTPLTSIRESVDLIGDGTFGDINDQQKKFLSIAEKETVRLTDMLTRLMSVSRMESESLELSYEEMDCAQLIQSTVERLEPTAQAASINIATQLPDQTMTCSCDPGHVQQLLLNLIGNSIKFSPKGGTVTVSLFADNAEIRMNVTDEGPGIPANEQGRIFHKYYRDPSVRESIDGVGLGLAIAKRIVDEHGGRIWIESEPGSGSTFCFTLPLGKPKERT